MSGQKWSQQPVASQVNNSDKTLIIQGGVSKQVEISLLQATSTTKSTLITLINSSLLSFPKWYLITDLAEPLYVLSTSANTLNVKAYSDAFPKDIIWYDTTDADSDNWFISYRCDTVRSFSAPYDWRTVTFGRYNVLYDLSATVFPITGISISINGQFIDVSGTAANTSELATLIANKIKADTFLFGGANLDYVYSDSTDLHFQQTTSDNSSYENLRFTDGDSDPQELEPDPTPLLFYTFGNNIDFTTNTFIPAPDGNATALISNNIHISGTGRSVFGTGLPKEIIIGSSESGAMRGDIYMGEETRYGMIGNRCAFMNLHNCTRFVIKDGCLKATILNRSDFILESDTFNITSNDSESNLVTTVNISESAVADISNYVVATNILILPSGSLGIIDIQVDLYSATKSYSIGNIVRSDGTNGGTNGLCYKSIANSNSGFLLSNAAKWLKADALGLNMGFLEIWSILQTASFPAILPNRYTLILKSSQNITLSFNPGTMGSYISTQTSGALVVGQLYTIATYVTGDNFTNVGAAQNITGEKFFATGTTPTTYTHGSTLTRIPKNLATSGSATRIVAGRVSPDPSDYIEFVVGEDGILSETSIYNYI